MFGRENLFLGVEGIVWLSRKIADRILEEMRKDTRGGQSIRVLGCCRYDANVHTFVGWRR